MEFRLILSADDKSGHLDFLPLVSAGFRKFFDCEIALVLVTQDDSAQEFAKKYVDHLESVPHIRGQWVMCQAKMARMWYACNHGDTVVSLDDIDLVPLQRDWRWNILSQRKPGHILTAGEEYYNTIPHEAGKAPTGMMTAESSVLKEIVNPSGLSYLDFFWSFVGKQKTFDGREDPAGHEANFSDESLFRVLRSKWPKRDTNFIRVSRGSYNAPNILDRAQWNCDIETLNSGGYWEGHLPKPPKQNKHLLKPLYDYIGIECDL